jgi:hypothetical protein
MSTKDDALECPPPYTIDSLMVRTPPKIPPRYVYSRGSSFPRADGTSHLNRPAPDRIRLSPAMLPFGDSVTFKDTSFFNRAGVELPSPSEVRSAAENPSDFSRPPPVVFRSMNLLVKYGSKITSAEGQCLWAIKRFLPEVPVPEVYGWCRDGEITLIYMELVQGATLEMRWNCMNEQEKVAISEQLKGMVDALARFEQDPADPFIGMCFNCNLDCIL